MINIVEYKSGNLAISVKSGRKGKKVFGKNKFIMTEDGQIKRR